MGSDPRADVGGTKDAAGEGQDRPRDPRGADHGGGGRRGGPVLRRRLDSDPAAVARKQKIDIGYLRAQWLDAESQIRAAGATMSQQEQQALAAKSGPAIAAALNQEVAAVTAQDQRLAALPWPSSMKADIDSFESSSAAALDQLRSAASNPFGYDATQINAAIAAFNTAANNVRHDLGLPPG